MHIKSFKTIAVISAICTLLSACGGGEKSTSQPSTGAGTPTSTSTRIAGVAATGAAMAAANVTIKDSTGATRSTTTDADGNYAFDTTGLNAPFVIKAVGLDNTSVYSVALASDLGGTINITPVSSLVIGNASGKSPESLFNTYSQTDATALSANLTTAIDNALTLLRPVFTALGVTPVATGILRGGLKADNTGLDKVLDAISISFTENTATIKDKAGSTIATDPLESNTAVTPTVSNSAALTDFASAAEGINQLLAQISANCGTQASSLTQACLSRFTSTAGGFLHESHVNPANHIAEFWADDASKVQWKNAAVIGNEKGGYKARFTYVASDNSKSGTFFAESIFVRDATDGNAWKFKGDQQRFLLDVFYNLAGNSFNIQAFNSNGAFPATVRTLSVTGPGLPTTGLLIGSDVQTDGNSNYRSGCIKLAAGTNGCSGSDLFTGASLLGTSQQYTFTARDVNNTALPDFSGKAWLSLRVESN
jgi:hypothetical protein